MTKLMYVLYLSWYIHVCSREFSFLNICLERIMKTKYHIMLLHNTLQKFTHEFWKIEIYRNGFILKIIFSILSIQIT